MLKSIRSSRTDSHASTGGDLQPDWLVLSLPVVLLHLRPAGAGVELSAGHFVPRGRHSAADSVCRLHRRTLAPHTCRSVRRNIYKNSLNATGT